jgi:hypothetical protein
MHQGNVFHLARTIACAAAVATLVALPAAANDRDHDRDRRGSHHHGHDKDDLADEIKALKARVRKLEGHLKAEEVAGTYTLRTYQTALLSAVPPRVSRIEHLIMTATLQLNANGSFSFSGNESGFNAIWQVPTNRERQDGADSGGGTWTYVDGTLALILDGGEVVSVTGGVGGRMFMNVHDNPADGTTTLLLLVKNL